MTKKHINNMIQGTFKVSGCSLLFLGMTMALGINTNPHMELYAYILLFLGTLFAPTEDRDVVGEGFTHKVGDKVTISEPNLGDLINYVNLSTDCPQWSFGIAAMVKNLSQRGLI